MADELERLHSETVSVRDKLVGELENKLASEKDGRNEERFLWILGTIIFIDIHVFSGMNNWAGPIAILLLELFLLIILARKLGVDEIVQWLDKLLSSFTNAK